MACVCSFYPYTPLKQTAPYTEKRVLLPTSSKERGVNASHRESHHEAALPTHCKHSVSQHLTHSSDAASHVAVLSLGSGLEPCSQLGRIVLPMVILMGLTFVDRVYMAVALNYSAQCILLAQCIIAYMRNYTHTFNAR